MKTTAGGFTSHTEQVNRNTLQDGAPGNWSVLFAIAAYAAIIMMILIPAQMIVFYIWPPPDTVISWFALFEKNKIIGLVDMDILLSVDYLLLAVVYLALYVLLKKKNASLMFLALALQLMAICIYFSSTAAFEMLTLSNRYAAAVTENDRLQYIAAGHALLALWQGTAFNFSYVLGGIALLLLSVVMYQSDIFSRTVALPGLFMGVLMLVPPTVGVGGMIISLLSLIPLIPWLMLIAQRLFRLSREARAHEAGTIGYL